MKTLALAILTVTLTGCVADRSDRAVLPAPQFAPAGAPITRVEAKHQFVILDFKDRVMPALGTKLTVYRGLERVGVVQLTPPARATFATADILEGELRVGDEAR